jgi:hypothetical protein
VKQPVIVLQEDDSTSCTKRLKLPTAERPYFITIIQLNISVGKIKRGYAASDLHLKTAGTDNYLLVLRGTNTSIFINIPTSIYIFIAIAIIHVYYVRESKTGRRLG